MSTGTDSAADKIRREGFLKGEEGALLHNSSRVLSKTYFNTWYFSIKLKC